MNEKLIDRFCQEDIVYQVLEAKRSELTRVSMKNEKAEPDLMNIMRLSCIRLSQIYQFFV